MISNFLLLWTQYNELFLQNTSHIHPIISLHYKEELLVNGLTFKIDPPFKSLSQTFPLMVLALLVIVAMIYYFLTDCKLRIVSWNIKKKKRESMDHLVTLMYSPHRTGGTTVWLPWRTVHAGQAGRPSGCPDVQSAQDRRDKCVTLSLHLAVLEWAGSLHFSMVINRVFFNFHLFNSWFEHV